MKSHNVSFPREAASGEEEKAPEHFDIEAQQQEQQEGNEGQAQQQARNPNERRRRSTQSMDYAMANADHGWLRGFWCCVAVGMNFFCCVKPSREGGLAGTRSVMSNAQRRASNQSWRPEGRVARGFYGFFTSPISFCTAYIAVQGPLGEEMRERAARPQEFIPTTVENSNAPKTPVARSGAQAVREEPSPLVGAAAFKVNEVAKPTVKQTHKEESVREEPVFSGKTPSVASLGESEFSPDLAGLRVIAQIQASATGFDLNRADTDSPMPRHLESTRATPGLSSVQKGEVREMAI